MMSQDKKGGDDLAASINSGSYIAEFYKKLRTNIFLSSMERPCKIILVTSAGADDDISLVTANLGVVIAQADSRVLIIDCGMRKPVMHRIFKVDGSRGLSGLLADELEADEVVCATFMDKLWLLPGGAVPGNPSELLGSRKMKLFLEIVADYYDYILLGAPSIVAFTDAALLATMSDGVVLVVKSGNTRFDTVREAKIQLEKSNARIIGVVLNEVKTSKSGYRFYKDKNKLSIASL